MKPILPMAPVTAPFGLQLLMQMFGKDIIVLGVCHVEGAAVFRMLVLNHLVLLEDGSTGCINWFNWYADHKIGGRWGEQQKILHCRMQMCTYTCVYTSRICTGVKIHVYRTCAEPKQRCTKTGLIVSLRKFHISRVKLWCRGGGVLLGYTFKCLPTQAPTACPTRQSVDQREEHWSPT